MKKSIIAAVIVVAAAIAGVTAYEVATANNTDTTVASDNVKTATSSTKSNETESSTKNSVTKNSSSESKKTNTVVANDSSKNEEVKPTATTNSKDVQSTTTTTNNDDVKPTTTTKSSDTSVSSNSSENTEGTGTTSSTKTSKAIEPTTSSSNNAESSGTSTQSSTSTSSTSSTSSTGATSSSSTSTNNMINGEPVLFNSNSQVSSYYGTWTVGNKVGAAVIGNGENVTSPTGDTVIMTKSLYSFDGTVIENPNYYIMSTSASSYFGSAGWTGEIGATSNGVIKFVIAVPSDVKVTSSTIYRYEKANKIIINDGNLIVLDSSQTAYSASLK